MPSALEIDTILDNIFQRLDVVSLTRCLCVCKTFCLNATRPLLWKPHVTERWTRWQVLTDNNLDWRLEFLTRIAIDTEIERQLQDICEDSKGQCSKISKLADIYGVRALDVLTHIYRDSEKRSLTERHYAGRLIHRIKKRQCLNFWSGQSNQDVTSWPATPGVMNSPTYIGLAMLSCAIMPFLEVDVKQVMNELALQFKETYLTDSELSEFEKAKRLVFFMRLDQGFGAAKSYYDIHNSLIPSVLAYRRGVPLSLAVVYQGIAHLADILGVDVMSFPGHVVVRHTEPGMESQMYIDLFQTQLHPKPQAIITEEDYASVEEDCIMTREQCEERFISRYGMAIRINPGPGMFPREIYARCMRNIMNADTNTEYENSGQYIRYHLMLTKYATSLQMAMCYAASRPQLQDFCLQVAEQHVPEDVDLLDSWVANMDRIKHIKRHDLKGQTTKPRVYDGLIDDYVRPVGSIVTRLKNGPASVVIRWTVDFDEAGEPDVLMTLLGENMQIEHVYARPSLCTSLRQTQAVKHFCSTLEIGKYFSHYDDNHGRFVPNAIWQRLFPKDHPKNFGTYMTMQGPC